MKPQMATRTPWRRIDLAVRTFLPILSTLGLGVLSVLPLGIPAWGTLAPPLMLAGVFYWSLARPDLLPPTAAFTLGLFQDIISGGPLGQTALVLVITQWTMRGQRRFLVNRPFLLLWVAFVPVAAAAAALDWIVYGLLNLHLMPVGTAATRMALGLILFPVMAWVILIPTHRAVPAET